MLINNSKILKYFDKVYITKLYCSRIFNDESYIICVGRNSKNCKSVPLLLPNIKKYSSPNLELVRSFEYSRQDIKFKMAEVVKNILFKRHSQNTENNIYSHAYDIYLEELIELLKELGYEKV